jgi:hypothetical protein
MSRSSLFLGVTIAIALHGLLFLIPGSGAPADPVPPVVMVPSAESPEPTDVSAPIPPPRATPPVEPVAPPVKMTEVVRGERADADQFGDTADAIDDASVPALSVEWSGPDQLRAVARAFGMRVLAVDARQQVVGEVLLTGPARRVEFTGQLGDFSNQVRALPVSFFGESVLTGSGATRLWVVTPAPIDGEFLQIQKQAILSRRLRVEDVRSMVGQFVPDGQGRFRLVVTRIALKSGEVIQHG